MIAIYGILRYLNLRYLRYFTVIYGISILRYLKEIRFVAYWSMKSGASYDNSCLVSKKNIFVNNIQGISIAALFVLSY